MKSKKSKKTSKRSKQIGEEMMKLAGTNGKPSSRKGVRQKTGKTASKR